MKSYGSLLVTVPLGIVLFSYLYRKFIASAEARLDRETCLLCVFENDSISFFFLIRERESVGYTHFRSWFCIF